MKLPPSGYILAQKSWVKFPTALRRCVLKTEVSIIFFTRKPPMLHPLYLYLYPTTPVSKPDAGAVTEAWRLGIWNVYSSTYLEKEGYYSVATSAEKRSQTSTSYCKESTGGAVVKWPLWHSQAGQPQPGRPTTAKKTEESTSLPAPAPTKYIPKARERNCEEN